MDEERLPEGVAGVSLIGSGGSVDRRSVISRCWGRRGSGRRSGSSGRLRSRGRGLIFGQNRRRLGGCRRARLQRTSAFRGNPVGLGHAVVPVLRTVRHARRVAPAVRRATPAGRGRDQGLARRGDLTEHRSLVTDVERQHRNRHAGRLLREEEHQGSPAVHLVAHLDLGDAIGREASGYQVVVVGTVDRHDLSELVPRHQVDEARGHVTVVVVCREGLGVHRVRDVGLARVLQLPDGQGGEVGDDTGNLAVIHVRELQPVRALQAQDANALHLQVCEQMCERDTNDGLFADCAVHPRTHLLGVCTLQRRAQGIAPLTKVGVSLGHSQQSLHKERVRVIDDGTTGALDDHRTAVVIQRRVSRVQEDLELVAQLVGSLGVIRRLAGCSRTTFELGDKALEEVVVLRLLVAQAPLGQRIALTRVGLCVGGGGDELQRLVRVVATQGGDNFRVREVDGGRSL